MKFILQYKVFGPYNYDRIIHNIEKNYSKRQLYRSDKWKDAFSLKMKINVIR